VKSLQSSLTEERVSNLDLDQTSKEQKIKIEELTDKLATEKLKNQQLSQNVQDLQQQTDDLEKHYLQIYQVQTNIINQQQQQLQQQMASTVNTNHDRDNEEDDEFGKYDIKFEDEHDDDSDDSEHSEQSKELRHRLLEEQMRHEQLKHAHRESITKLEQYELDQLQHHEDDINSKLREEVDSLKRELENERKKRENLDKERRNSLAALSQNMFKKLLDSEHQHYDDKSDLEKQCLRLKLIVKHLEKSKQNLLKETSKTIDDLRMHIKFLSSRLQKYEKWD